MASTLKDKMDALSADRRGRIEARAAELTAAEMSLRALRQARKLTQERMGESLGIGQEGVSRLEKRSDLLLSTLCGYVEAMGGRLRLVAEFPNQPPVVLSGLTDVENGNPPRGGRPRRQKHAHRSHAVRRG